MVQRNRTNKMYIYYKRWYTILFYPRGPERADNGCLHVREDENVVVAQSQSWMFHHSLPGSEGLEGSWRAPGVHVCSLCWRLMTLEYGNSIRTKYTFSGRKEEGQAVSTAHSLNLFASKPPFERCYHSVNPPQTHQKYIS